MSAPQMTERQARDWPAAIAEAQEYVGTSTVTEDVTHHDWRVWWEDEARPGRGHMMRAMWCDGEYLVDVSMDVYGGPNVAVASLDWIHNGSDEQCDCDRCEAERDEGNEEA